MDLRIRLHDERRPSLTLLKHIPQHVEVPSNMEVMRNTSYFYAARSCRSNNMLLKGESKLIPPPQPLAGHLLFPPL